MFGKNSVMTDEQVLSVRSRIAKIQAETYRIPRAPLRSDEFLGNHTVNNPWARTVEFRKITGMGMVKLLSEGGNDLPPLSLAVKFDTKPIYEWAGSYGWNKTEIMQWLTTEGRIDLSSEEAALARQVADEKTDDVALNGDAQTQIEGFYDSSNVPVATVPADGEGDKTELKTKDLNKCAATIRALIKAFETNNKDRNGESRIKAEGLTLILPGDAYDYLHDTTVTNGESSLLEKLKSRFSEEISFWKKAGALNTKGVSGKGRAILYKNDVKYVAKLIPLPFYQETVQQEGFDFKVPYMCRCGGTIVKVPTAIVYADGV